MKKDPMYVIAIIAIAAISWTMYQHFETAKDVKALQLSVTLLLDNHDHEIRHDLLVPKFWRLHSWAKIRINELRIENGEPLAEWPRMD